MVTFNGPVGQQEVFNELCNLSDAQFNDLATELQKQITSVSNMYLIRTL